VNTLGAISMSSKLPKIPDSGLKCYLDASLRESWPRSGTTWFDLSGNTRHFIWGSVSFTDAGDLSYFNTSGRVATGPASNSFGIANGDYTILYVGQTNSATANAAFKFHRSGSDVVQNRSIFVHPSWTDSANPTFYFDQGGCCGANQRVSVNVAGRWNQTRLWAFRRGSDGRKIFCGPTLLATETTASADITMNSAAATINPSDEGYNWDGRIHAFMAYNRAVSDAELQGIYNYFAARGLTN